MKKKNNKKNDRGLVKIDFNKKYWLLLVNKNISFLKFILKDKRGRKLKVIIKKIIPPGQFNEKFEYTIDSDLGKDFSINYSKAKSFLDKILERKTWLLIGETEDEDRFPILISYYQEVNLAIYTLSLPDDVHYFNQLQEPNKIDWQNNDDDYLDIDFSLN